VLFLYEGGFSIYILREELPYANTSCYTDDCNRVLLFE